MSGKASGKRTHSGSIRGTCTEDMIAFHITLKQAPLQSKAPFYRVFTDV